MQSSSFGGCCSLRVGAFVVGIVHLICVPLLWRYQNNPFYDLHPWTPFLITLMPATVLLLIGATKRNVDFVFPFVCMHFVMILMMICHVCKLLIESSFLRFTRSDDTIILVSELIIVVLMIYFFTVIFAFYQELLQERFTSTMSMDNSINGRRAQNIENILNNFDYQQPIKLNSEKQMMFEVENPKQSVA